MPTLLRIIGRILKYGLIAIVGIVLAGLAIEYVPRVLGIYINVPYSYVADIAIRRNKPELCKNIYIIPLPHDFWVGFMPVGKFQTKMCLQDVAERTKDPEACRLLVGNEDVRRCVFSTFAGLFPEPPIAAEFCWFEKGGTNVLVKCTAHRGDSEENARVLLVPKCVTATSEKMRDTCYQAAAEYVPSFIDCLKVGTKTRDICWIRVAEKLRDRSFCANVQHPVRRKGCDVLAEAL